MLVIEFAQGTTLLREDDRPSQLPIHRNGPPGTFVRVENLRVSLPTDQIIAADDSDGQVRVSFGGFEFAGLSEGRLMFRRVRELRAEHQLSPERSHTMFLEPLWVAAVHSDGRQIWPDPQSR
jgi:hypothetical protein